MSTTRILIVEDESVIAKDIEVTLEHMGYEVAGHEVAGEDAQRAVERDAPDVVLMDIALQGPMDGVEAARRIHAAHNIPVVYLTAYADEAILERVRQTAPFGYIIKPFKAKELRLAIEMALLKHATEEKLRKANRALKTLSSCNKALLHATDRPRLLREICQIIVRAGGYPLAWVGLVRADKPCAVNPVAWYGEASSRLTPMNLVCDDGLGRECPTATAVRTGEPLALQRISPSAAGEPLCSEAARQDYASCVVLPMAAEGRTMGVLNIYSSEPEAFDADEFDLLVDLSRNLAFGLVSMEHRKERERAEEELKKHRGRLEELVAERTVELQMEIAERRRAEEELVKAQKLESLGILAGGIAHDFNNILTSILTNMSLAKLSLPPGAVLDKRLAIAEKAALRARHLTQQLLTFSQGGAPVRRTATVAELLRETTDFALRGSNVRCELHLPEDLWAVSIDEGQMSQALNNLIINADQAMPAGGVITIEVSNEVVTGKETLPLRPGRYVRLAVTDQGVGIPKEHMLRVFDPYFTTKEGGSGLGLASTYSIVKKHDGHISVLSEPGRGTTFLIHLPASDEPLPVQASEPGGIVSGTGRLLIMDDDPDIRESLGDALSFFGYEVDFAEDGRQTIRRYREALQDGQGFDAVIMDLTIPGGMGGAEAIKELLAIDPGLKAIVASGYSNDPVMSEFREHGFSGVITKPYQIEELSRLLREVIRN
jgi:signal transduction histidine kinase/DNA-binding response OmpR family regulator